MPRDAHVASGSAPRIAHVKRQESERDGRVPAGEGLGPALRIRSDRIAGAILLDSLNSIRGASPLGLPYTLSRAPLRRRAPFTWLARHARSRRAATPSDSPTRSLARRC